MLRSLDHRGRELDAIDRLDARVAGHLSGHDARPEPDGEHPDGPPSWPEQERQVRQRLLLVVDPRAALPDAHAVDQHDQLARVGCPLDHLHRGDQSLLVELDRIGLALFDADERPRAPIDEQRCPEHRSAERIQSRTDRALESLERAAR